MSIADISTAREEPGDVMAQGTVAGLDDAQAMIDKARATATASGARVAGWLAIHCGSADEVDAIAAQWGVPAGWTADLSQYRTLGGTWPVELVALYIPRVAGRVAA